MIVLVDPDDIRFHPQRGLINGLNPLVLEIHSIEYSDDSDVGRLPFNATKNLLLVMMIRSKLVCVLADTDQD